MRKPTGFTKAPSRILSASIEMLETRIALNASPAQIAQVLDLDSGVTVSYSGDARAVSTLTFGTAGALLGFPSGADGDFLVLSTGVADQINRGGNFPENHGTDFGAIGAAGDTATVSFTLAVPSSTLPQRLKFDFMFLSEEFPDFVGQEFNDFFTATVNGVNIAKDQLGNDISVNNVFFTTNIGNGTDLATGTYFNGRTSKLTASYSVPAGTTSLDISFSIGDAGDGRLDSAAIIDNVRFETPQVVFLDFDGATVANHFGDGTSMTIPAFSAADVGSLDTTANVIASIVAGLTEKYEGFNIIFTTIQPPLGEYQTVVIGGNNDLPINISGASPLVKAEFTTTTPTFRQFSNLGATGTLFGQAAAVDIGNLDRSDLAVVFSGVFASFYSTDTTAIIEDRLVVTLSHEIAHNLGVRHLGNSFVDDVMKKNSPRNSDAIFTDELRDLAEGWSDGALKQNDAAYLGAVLGTDGLSSLSASLVPLLENLVALFPKDLFDVTFGFDTSEGGDGSGVEERGVRLFKFTSLKDAVQFKFPVLPLGTKFFMSGASKPDGELDVFTGKPLKGKLALEDSLVSLFNADGTVKSKIPLAKGKIDSFKSFGSLKLVTNDLGEGSMVTKNQKFTDADGDTYTVSVKGPGMVSVLLDDVDADGNGGIARLAFEGTSAKKTSITIKVKGGGGDGMVNIQEIAGIEGAGLKSFKATKSDLHTIGLHMDGHLGSLSLHGITDGASVTEVGDVGAKIKISVGDLSAGATISVGSKLTSLVAKSGISDATIIAPSVTELKTVTFTNSQLYAGFTPNSLLNPFGGGGFAPGSEIKSFKVTGATDAFSNSFVGADTIGKIALTSVKGANNGTTFGIIAGTSIKSVSVKNPDFDFVSPGPGGFVDFSVAII